MTLRQIALDAARTLTAAGLTEETSRREAALLARHALGWDAARWLVEAGTEVAPDFLASFSPLVQRRAAREPLAYIVGEREFYGRPFAVTRDVLIPRPETELVVDTVLALLDGRDAPRLLDIGTGSGCLAVTLAVELPQARVIGTDISEAAIAVARENARRFGTADRTEWRAGDLLAGADGVFDVIASNPPYVPERERPSLEPEVVKYEPGGALFAGAEGLDAIERLVPAAAAALSPDGWLVMEIGYGQADAVARIVAASGLRLAALLPDLRSIPRVAVAAPSDAGDAGL